ncbi:hypothetical protein IV203_036907 [Nitzschia inconspicua]|uniref:Uncharacterized protein n=1 Tax=Nitzschia inconspicua TaxID=303405 RepID=A0A9K3LJ33_9STRA|nr:hypothetical protein IV203_036907 [Nitzschia inconspicua]
MAQGSHKLGGKSSGNASNRKRAKSAGAKKRQTVKAKTTTRKGSSNIERNKGIIEATKAINRKNERIIAAKACTAGTNFFLKDIAEKGKKEGRRQTAVRDKKQSKSNSMSDRLKDQIQKLK